MMLTRLNTATAWVLALGLVVTGAGALTQRVLLAGPADQDKKKPSQPAERVEGQLHALDAAKNTLTLRTSSKDAGTGQKNVQDRTFVLAPDARIELAQGGKAGSKVVPLAELKAGMRVVLSLSEDKKTVTRVQAAFKDITAGGAVKAVDAARNTITISTKDPSTKQNLEKTFDVAADARVALAGHGKEGEKVVKLADLKENMRVNLRLSQDEKTVVGVSVPAPTAEGVLKAVDTAKNSVIVTVGAKAKAQDITYEVQQKAPVVIDGKESQLTDLKEGSPVFLRLSPENGGVVAIQVGEPGKKKPK